MKNAIVTPAGRIDSVSAFNIESFAESYLKSPLARMMRERGEPLEFFLPIQRSDCAEWSGVNITIAGVTKERITRQRAAPATPERGNGYSSNPHGPLKPGDFGVHSHPDTAKLLKRGSGN